MTFQGLTCTFRLPRFGSIITGEIANSNASKDSKIVFSEQLSVELYFMEGFQILEYSIE